MTQSTSPLDLTSATGPSKPEVRIPSSTGFITLRRAGFPDFTTVGEQLQMYRMFLTGTIDTLTLRDVEIVAWTSGDIPDQQETNLKLNSLPQEDSVQMENTTSQEPVLESEAIATWLSELKSLISDDTNALPIGGGSWANPRRLLPAQSANHLQSAKLGSHNATTATQHLKASHDEGTARDRLHQVNHLSSTPFSAPVGQEITPNSRIHAHHPLDVILTDLSTTTLRNEERVSSLSSELRLRSRSTGIGNGGSSSRTLPSNQEKLMLGKKKPVPRSIPLVDCQACREGTENPIYVNCGHAFCHECLNRLVRSGTANRASWPPKCCASVAWIEVEAVQAHLDEEVFIRYVSVSEEFNDRNPTYCANKSCSTYFPQARLRTIQGKFIQCHDCDTRTCSDCKQNAEEHLGPGKSCKAIRDLMTSEDQLLARKKKWKQCPGCRNLVERIDGCPHISCPCGVDFCYDCGESRRFNHTCSCSGAPPRPRRQPPTEGGNLIRLARQQARPILSQRPGPVGVDGTNPPARRDRLTLVGSGHPRSEPAPATLTPRDRQHISTNYRPPPPRVGAGSGLQAGLATVSTALDSKPSSSSLALSGQPSDNDILRRQSDRVLRPRPKPQYDNSRPLFQTQTSPVTSSSLQMPPARRVGLSPANLSRVAMSEALLSRIATNGEKRSHSPETHVRSGVRRSIRTIGKANPTGTFGMSRITGRNSDGVFSVPNQPPNMGISGPLDAGVNIDGYLQGIGRGTPAMEVGMAARATGFVNRF